MALPNLPPQGTNPWYVPRTNWDNAVAADLETRVKINTLSVLAPAATGSNQAPALQAALNSAASFGLWLQLNGAHQISGQITVPTGAKIDGRGGSITMTANLTVAFRLTSVTGIRFRDVVINGKTTDYINSSAVYAATAIYITGSSSNIVIEGCSLLGWAGNGIYLGAGTSNASIRNNKLTGSGPTYITSNTFNYSSGINADPGVSNVLIQGNDISGASQGVVTGDDLRDWRVIGNFIHDIPGQHGLYLESGHGMVIADNVVRNTALLGMKIQIGNVAAGDAENITITGNVFRDCGAQGILLTNTVGTASRLKNIVVSNNAIARASGGGIEINNALGAHFAGNMVVDSLFGMRINSSQKVTVSQGQFTNLGLSGLKILSSQEVVLDGAVVYGCGNSNTPSDQFGIMIDGATTSEVTVRSCKIDGTGSLMAFGIYVIAGTSTTMDFEDTVAIGATSRGWRLQTPGAVRTFKGMRLAGTAGAALNLPTNYAPIANATNATDVITQLNALLAVHRAQGDIPT